MLRTPGSPRRETTWKEDQIVVQPVKVSARKEATQVEISHARVKTILVVKAREHCCIPCQKTRNWNTRETNIVDKECICNVAPLAGTSVDKEVSNDKRSVSNFVG